jgi:hypothetical protein
MRRVRRQGFDISYAMIDLFSSGLAAGLLLFFLAIQHRNESGRLARLAGGIPSSSTVVLGDFGVGNFRAVLFFKTPDKKLFKAFPQQFTRKGGHLVFGNAPGTENGWFEMLSGSPWIESLVPERVNEIVLRIAMPVNGPWCLGAAIPETTDELRIRNASEYHEIMGTIRIFAPGPAVGQIRKISVPIGDARWYPTPVNLRTGADAPGGNQCSFG